MKMGKMLKLHPAATGSNNSLSFVYIVMAGLKKMGLNKSIQKEENSGKIFSNG